MINKELSKFKIILASGSPRRQQFFKDLDLDFEIRLKEIEEIYPDNLKAEEITNYLAELKAKAFDGEILDNEILITSTATACRSRSSSTRVGRPPSTRSNSMTSGRPPTTPAGAGIAPTCAMSVAPTATGSPPRSPKSSRTSLRLRSTETRHSPRAGSPRRLDGSRDRRRT